MRHLLVVWILLAASLPVWGNTATEPKKLTAAQVTQQQQSIQKTLGRQPDFFKPYRSESVRAVVLERVRLTNDRKTLSLYCNVGLAQIGIRPELLEKWAGEVRKKLPKEYAETEVKFYSYNIPAERFIPNYYRKRADRDASRTSSPFNRAPLVMKINDPLYDKGLSDRHIALWGGHGWYFEGDDSVWKWQRPALFTTREDLNTQEFTVRYVTRMLENAGAVVTLPRERDPQHREFIIDNDKSTLGCAMEMVGNWKQMPNGFFPFDTLVNQNPFTEGTSLLAGLEGDLHPQIIYRPNLREKEHYGVYVSWQAFPTNITNARYTVYHAGGMAEFQVNQQIGGGMWVWLGSFDLDPDSRIVLSAPYGTKEGTLSADAVKIGGGMGNILRADQTGGYSRYSEAARYWMQYSGVPDSIYAQDTKSKDNKAKRALDYSDSFKATGDWGTYLRKHKNLPVDVAVGIHTDAGISDTIVGTMAIHYTNKTTAKYSNGKSKMAGRDLADLIQTQIVEDIRAKYLPGWTRRSLYDKSYAEISRPDYPAMLIEMFSHQNANDMAIAMDPRFRFDISRAIYKGILRFVSDRYGRQYVVQPLPPQSVASYLHGLDSVTLSWEATADPLERSAVPKYYKVYHRGGIDGSFDEGSIVQTNRIVLPLQADGQVHSYRVTALNDGGESFPSETVSVGRPRVPKGRALIVNLFDRLSPPALKKDEQGKILGFDLDEDPGVPYIQDRAIIGRQFNFSPDSAFVDNDNPGWGASGSELYPRGIVGNDFDLARFHGQALLENGYAFASCSRRAFETTAPVAAYDLINLLCGAQRGYPDNFKIFDARIVSKLEPLFQSNSKIIISGSYIGSDPSASTDITRKFGYLWEGKTRATRPRNPVYTVPTFDRLEPVDGAVAIEYRNYPPVIRSGNIFAAGFPLEYLAPEELKALLTLLLDSCE